MNAVLISINPKWCKLIAEGKKTIEVRKTRPKIDVPFKCYIYCTKNKETTFFSKEVFDGEKGKWAIPYVGNGKVIGEFICDRIDEFSVPCHLYYSEIDNITATIIEKACLKPRDIHMYNGVHQTYGWRITDLVIYDKPKELVEFKPIKCEKNFDGECIYKGRCKHQVKCSTWGYRTFKCEKRITKAPQSWQFVEELGVRV